MLTTRIQTEESTFYRSQLRRRAERIGVSQPSVGPVLFRPLITRKPSQGNIRPLIELKERLVESVGLR